MLERIKSLETRHRVEVAAPVDSSFLLTPSLKIHLKAGIKHYRYRYEITMWFKFSELIIKRVPPSHGESPALKRSCSRINQYRKLNFPNMYSCLITQSNFRNLTLYTVYSPNFCLYQIFYPLYLHYAHQLPTATQMKLEM